MTPDEARDFLTACPIVVRDPETNADFARATYHHDGTCEATFDDGNQSVGRWGLTETGYWTIYENFRDGARHEFSLKLLSTGRSQAYHADGRRAFLQVWE